MRCLAGFARMILELPSRCPRPVQRDPAIPRTPSARHRRQACPGLFDQPRPHPDHHRVRAHDQAVRDRSREPGHRTYSRRSWPTWSRPAASPTPATGAATATGGAPGTRSRHPAEPGHEIAGPAAASCEPAGAPARRRRRERAAAPGSRRSANRPPCRSRLRRTRATRPQLGSVRARLRTANRGRGSAERVVHPSVEEIFHAWSRFSAAWWVLLWASTKKEVSWTWQRTNCPWR